MTFSKNQKRPERASKEMRDQRGKLARERQIGGQVMFASMGKRSSKPTARRLSPNSAVDWGDAPAGHYRPIIQYYNKYQLFVKWNFRSQNL
jgi:hypothetical protein